MFSQNKPRAATRPGSVGSLAAAVALVALALATPAQAQPPNIILIVTDDQRFDTLRYMPTVSRELVGKGVSFSNAFVVNPLCCPSRASILTGQYSHTNGVWQNSGTHGGFPAFADDSTLPTWLDDAGYETMLVGKYIHGYRAPLVRPTYVPPGWDRWRAYFGTLSYYGYRLTDGRELRRYGYGAGAYATDVLARHAVSFLRESGPHPFFLYFAPFAPHQSPRFSVPPAPRHVNAFAGHPYKRLPSVNEADMSDKPAHIRRRKPYPRAKLTELREEQLEALLAVDDAVAGMLTALEDTGKLADTMVVFTTDNGNLWGEHRWAGKRLPYEESIRVPLVIRYDRLGVPARVERRAALNIDLAPTIAAAAGVTVSRRDGRSLLPLLGGGAAAWRNQFQIEYHDPPFFPSYCGFRSRRWKYVQYGNGEEELYNLLRDRYELRNLAEAPRHRERVIAGRDRVSRSECRPPRFRPLAPCTLYGTQRADVLRGTRRRDWICAGRGPDRIHVRGGRRDVVRCGAGVDRVRADRRDLLVGCERVRF
jgi:N-acetylglucosamine-6-sulfatase